MSAGFRIIVLNRPAERVCVIIQKQNHDGASIYTHIFKGTCPLVLMKKIFNVYTEKITVQNDFYLVILSSKT